MSVKDFAVFFKGVLREDGRLFPVFAKERGKMFETIVVRRDGGEYLLVGYAGRIREIG